MKLTGSDNRIRLTKIGGNVYLTTSRLSHEDDFKAGPEDTGRLFFSIDLGKDIQHVSVRTSDATSIDSTAKVYFSTVDKNGNVRLGIVKYRFDQREDGKLYIDYGGDEYRVLKFAEEKIKEMHGNNINYVVMADYKMNNMNFAASQYFVFTKDGRIETYILKGLSIPSKEPELVKVERKDAHTGKSIKQIDQYIMMNEGNTWLEKSGNNYYISVLDGNNTLMSFELPKSTGELLFANDTKIWDAQRTRPKAEYRESIVTNKGILPVTYSKYEHQKCNFVEWKVDEGLLREGVARVAETHNASTNFYILTKQNNFYKVMFNEGQLFTATLIRKNVKDFILDEKLGITKDGKLFSFATLPSSTDPDYMDNYFKETTIDLGDRKIKSFVTSGHLISFSYSRKEFEERIKSIEEKIKNYNNIINMPSLLNMVDDDSDGTAFEYVVGLDEKGEYLLVIKNSFGESEGDWQVVKDVFPVKVSDGDDYITRTLIQQPSYLLNKVCG